MKFEDGSDEFYKFLKGNYCDSMFLHDTTCAEVNKEIDKMANKSSCGIDDINSKVVKHVAPYISLPLSHIFNLTFSTGKVPDEFKVALVTPVYKSSECIVKLQTNLCSPLFFENTRKTDEQKINELCR